MPAVAYGMYVVHRCSIFACSVVALLPESVVAVTLGTRYDPGLLIAPEQQQQQRDLWNLKHYCDDIPFTIDRVQMNATGGRAGYRKS